MNLHTKLVNMIKRGYISRVLPDTAEVPQAQVTHNEKTSKIEISYPYGLSANAPEIALVTLFSIQGQEENKVGIANTPTIRIKNLKEGEVVVYNVLTGSSVKFNENGDITVSSAKNIEITDAGEINITTNSRVKINGDLEVTGDITFFKDGGASQETTLSGFRDTFNIHDHLENNGLGPTDPPGQTVP